LSLTRLLDDPLPALGVNVTGSGSGTVSLPVQATIGGTALSANPIPLALSVADSFASTPPTLAALPDALKVFTNLSAADVLRSLAQLGAWLGDFRNASSLTANLPFTSGTRLGSVLDLPAALGAELT